MILIYSDSPLCFIVGKVIRMDEHIKEVFVVIVFPAAEACIIASHIILIKNGGPRVYFAAFLSTILIFFCFFVF